jgi:threonine/homoserine/homoserine lactone efflux protein
LAGSSLVDNGQRTRIDTVMISWHSFLIYCTVYAIAIAVPGPGVIAMVARALGGGFRPAIPAAAGMALGDWIYMTCSAFGLAVLAQTLGGLFLIVKLAAAVYLIYLGWCFWHAPVKEMEAIAPQTASSSFVSQLMVTLGNPKAMAFFVALLPTVIDVSRIGVVGYVQLSAATAVLIPAIMLSYAVLASRLRGFLASAKARKRLNRGAAVIMAGAGVGVAVS